ncbi:hypothetical protein ACWD4Z_37555 [Streptomyces antibioticus]
MARDTQTGPRGGLSVASPVVEGRLRDQAPEMEVPAMVSRLRVPTVGGPAGHGDTPLATRASRLTGRLRKFSPGERDLGVSAPDTRYNITTSSGTIAECPGFYQLIAGFPNRRKDSTMVAMTARAP